MYETPASSVVCTAQPQTCRRACTQGRRARRRAGCTSTRRARTRTRSGRPRPRRCGSRTRRPSGAAARTPSRMALSTSSPDHSASAAGGARLVPADRARPCAPQLAPSRPGRRCRHRGPSASAAGAVRVAAACPAVRGRRPRRRVPAPPGAAGTRARTSSAIAARVPARGGGSRRARGALEVPRMTTSMATPIEPPDLARRLVDRAADARSARG